MKGLYEKRGWWYWQAPKPKDGGERPKAVALRTQDEMEAIGLALRHAEGADLIAAETRGTMREILPQYYEEKAEDAKKTRQGRKQILDAFTELMGNPLVREIDANMIRRWRVMLSTTGGSLKSCKPVSPASMTSYLITLKAFLSWAVEKRMIRTNPVKEFRRQTTVRVSRRGDFHTREKREKILATPCRDYIGLMLHLGYFAGLREGEMLAFQPGWLWFSEDGTQGTITVKETPITFTDGTQGWWRPKVKELRTIPLHPRLIAFLKNYGIRHPFMIAPDKPLWPTDEKKSKRFDTKRAMATHGRLCGEPKLGYHVLRRSFATLLSIDGKSVNVIAALLGDTVKVTQDHYIGFSPSTSCSLDGL